MPGYEKWKRFALLHWSAFYNALECTKVPCFSVPILDDRVGQLRICLLNPFVGNLKILLEYDARVDKPNSDNETPLHLAAKNGYTRIVKASLQRDHVRLR